MILFFFPKRLKREFVKMASLLYALSLIGMTMVSLKVFEKDVNTGSNRFLILPLITVIPVINTITLVGFTLMIVSKKLKDEEMF